MSEDGRPTDPPIIRRGRGHTYYVDELKLPGSTRVLNQGYPKDLTWWSAREAADYAVDHWDDLCELPITERRELILTAHKRDRDLAARRGQEVHRLAERYIAGEEIHPPDELVGHVDAYVKFVEDWQPRELYVEAPVANVQRGYCGTLDVIADLVDGFRWLYDLKTTRSGVFRENALQVTSYRFAEWIQTSDGVVPMPPVDSVGVLWLKGDRTYEFVEVDAGLATFRVFLHALEIARFTEREDVLGDALTGPPLREVQP